MNLENVVAGLELHALPPPGTYPYDEWFVRSLPICALTFTVLRRFIGRSISAPVVGEDSGRTLVGTTPKPFTPIRVAPSRTLPFTTLPSWSFTSEETPTNSLPSNAWIVASQLQFKVASVTPWIIGTARGCSTIHPNTRSRPAQSASPTSSSPSEVTSPRHIAARVDFRGRPRR